jgi:hypothetical protein
MSRYTEGMETGRLKCCRCNTVKPVAFFPRNHKVGWSSWCTPCHGQYQRANKTPRETRVVYARLKPEAIEYLLNEMLPDAAPKSVGWIISKIVTEAVSDHKKACMQIKMIRPHRPAPSADVSWPTRAQLMGGR